MKNQFATLAALFLTWNCATRAEAVKDREGAVRDDKAALENDPRWNYNDLEKGFAEARKTAKPLLVVLRCVPCIACSGIDASVLMGGPDLKPLLDQFVCVRVINANALDLTKFQFDYDLSFSTLFFNGDGTCYGRYGSWTHQQHAEDKTTTGYKAAMEAVLALHRQYPANKAILAGKQGGPAPFKTPIEFPSLSGKYARELNWQGKVVQSCVHCHQIGDAIRENYRERREPIPTEWLVPHPGPDTLGLAMAEDAAATVKTVQATSPAAKAGLRSGDRITSFAGQPLVSPADLSWALHRATDGAVSLPVTVQRKEEGAVKLTVELAPGWKFKADRTKRVGAWQMRGMATGGLVLEDLDDEARRQAGLDLAGLALRVKFVGQYNKHAAGKNAGFQLEDIVTTLDGMTTRMSEAELMARLLQTRKVGDSVKAKVVRGKQELELTLPMQ